MDYEIKDNQIFSGADVAESLKYHKYEDVSGGVWLVADQPNAGDNIYFLDDCPNSQGFGGATLTFQLVDGTKIALRGPWHSNSNSLYKHTGVDVRDKIFTFVVISEDADYRTAKNVLYMDNSENKYVLGSYNRGEEIAKKWANKLSKPVFVYAKSLGGSIRTCVRPDGWSF